MTDRSSAQVIDALRKNGLEARITELEARAEKVLALAEAALKNVNEAFFMPAETALDRIRDIHYGKGTP